MTILLSGGGSGGHITPLLAVAHELKQQIPDVRIVYVGERGGKFAQLAQNNEAIDEIRTVFAGKFRRYHGESFISHVLDFKTLALNIRDALFVLIGTMQSWFILGQLKPKAMFLKGGFVGVPVGLAAASWRIPFITHDSDAAGGLANRLVSRWASFHATALPPEYYSYSHETTKQVGVIVSSDYAHVSKKMQSAYKEELGIDSSAPVVLVTGGSLGAQRLNALIAEIAPVLLDHYQDLVIIHQVGKANVENVYHGMIHERLKVLPFMEGMHRYSGAADVIVTRAGANTLAELGVQGKACIVVPNAVLTGGHQLKNAEYLNKKSAAIILQEEEIQANPTLLEEEVAKLIDNPDQRQALADAIHDVTLKDASKHITHLLLEIANYNLENQGHDISKKT